MNIHILGNGGALNDGLPYNAFMVNEELLCETPPDIMLSIKRDRVRLHCIKTVYISHLHGDHVFGFPFLVLSAFFSHVTENKSISYKIVGPKGIGSMCRDLVERAFTSNHPCISWMKRHCTFAEIESNSRVALLEGFETTFFELDHLLETYGFLVKDADGKVPFAYVADTRWCDEIPRVLEQGPLVVLIDLNGEDDDPEPVHLSRKELKEKALPITGQNTVYYGTHLKQAFQPQDSLIQCAGPGSGINIG